MKKPPSKVVHNRPPPFFSVLPTSPKPAKIWFFGNHFFVPKLLQYNQGFLREFTFRLFIQPLLFECGYVIFIFCEKLVSKSFVRFHGKLKRAAWWRRCNAWYSVLSHILVSPCREKIVVIDSWRKCSLAAPPNRKMMAETCWRLRTGSTLCPWRPASDPYIRPVLTASSWTQV